MPEPEAATSPSSHTNSGLVSWWIRLCRHLWEIAVFLGVTVLLGLVINVLSTWLTSSHGTLPPDTPLTSLMTHWPITVLIGCCLLLIAALAWAVGRRVPSAVQAYLPTAQDRERMQRRLRLRYEQMLAQSLQGAVQVELGLISRPAAVHSAVSLSLRLPDQPEEPLPPHTSIKEAYELAQQELLILGEPGSGKSTLLLELAHHLVEQSEQDATYPLPVLLPLSSWAVSRPPLEVWLTEQLTLLYNVSRPLSQQWIQAKQVLPLLDGLDEMEASARAACIAAINVYHRDHLRPLVACSRTAEYAAATRHERLTLHTAVVVQPLSREQVDTYVANLGKPLAALRAALRKNAMLQELATTPLMLHVLILTYHGTSVRELSRKEMQLQEQIWTDYVERMVSRKGDVRRYPLSTTRAWLGWLAREMHQRNQTIFSLEQLQPDWLPKGQGVGLFIMLSALSMEEIKPAEVFTWSWKKFMFQLSGLNREIKPAEALTWSWKKFMPSLLNGLFGGLFGGLLFGMLFGMASGPTGGLLIGLHLGPFFGLFIGLLSGLLDGFSREQLTERLALSPNEGIRRSTRYGLLFGLAAGLFGGLFGGLLGGLLSTMLGSTLVGLGFGLLVGLEFGLLAAALQPHFLITAI